ncbi:hypothetical protein WJ55_27790 [Burkholderia ubonensis]|nr:hypothetical protein WJ34_32875 [Burkholderia ubonensis]KVH22241.1 hypothetical protein WJ37_14385 [Burkholderia ubonensis]KVH50864.1 hypothetical protein WJ38_01115 [Burkholderia ubonensis]KVH81237.1 hypothetical protein WJ43_30235 [Burkholderia ubonensis]KVM27854.1 hypothetical protein WJ55_27790 [Burkholderia ubonensis]
MHTAARAHLDSFRIQVDIRAADAEQDFLRRLHVQYTVDRFDSHVFLRRKLHAAALGLHNDLASRRDQAHALPRKQ